MRFYPKYVQGRDKIDIYIAEGEHDMQDFKVVLPSKLKIARTLAAFANGKGGRLLVGVNDNGRLEGVDVEEEMFEIHEVAENFCDPPVNLEFIIHEIDDMEILEVDVLKSLRRPHAAQDDKGIWHIYIRVGDQTLQANLE